MGFCKAHGAQGGHCFRIKPVGVSGYPPVSLLAAAEIQTQRHQQVGLLRRKSLETSASISFENRRSPASPAAGGKLMSGSSQCSKNLHRTHKKSPCHEPHRFWDAWYTWDTFGIGSTTTHPGTRRRLLRPPSC